MTETKKVKVQTYYNSIDEKLVLWGVDFKLKKDGIYIALLDEVDAKEMVKTKRVEFVK